MEDRNSTYSNQPALGIPYSYRSNIATGIPLFYPNEAQPQPTIVIPARNNNEMPPPPPLPRDEENNHPNLSDLWYSLFGAAVDRNQRPPQPRDRENYHPKQCALLFSLMVAFIVIIICLSIVFDPKKPKVEVESMIVSPFNVSGTTSDPTITAHWDIGFMIRNPSKRVKSKYKQIKVSIYYKTEFLSGTIIIKPFGLHGKSQTLLKVRSGALEKELDNGVSLSLAEDMRKGSMEFNIYLNGLVHSGTYFGYHWMEASCSSIRVGFSTNATATVATMLGGSSRCKVRQYKQKY